MDSTFTLATKEDQISFSSTVTITGLISFPILTHVTNNSSIHKLGWMVELIDK